MMEKIKNKCCSLCICIDYDKNDPRFILYLEKNTQIRILIRFCSGCVDNCSTRSRFRTCMCSFGRSSAIWSFSTRMSSQSTTRIWRRSSSCSLGHLYVRAGVITRLGSPFHRRCLVSMPYGWRNVWLGTSKVMSDLWIQISKGVSQVRRTSRWGGIAWQSLCTAHLGCICTRRPSIRS